MSSEVVFAGSKRLSKRSCLMSLPTELKLKILESLPGASVAKMACLCKEMRYLASDSDLWKQKCLEESTNVSVVNNFGSDSVNWKATFAGFWKRQVTDPTGPMDIEVACGGSKKSDLMSLPTELKLKILELLPGASIAEMACLCKELQYVASDNYLWKQKCLEEEDVTIRWSLVVETKVHAVMLETGFVLLDSGSDKFSDSKKSLLVSLRWVRRG
ncbi:hypothetical protein AALP_AA2G230200 [Arabis alpina]|uniref:F-box domain-containing protein n=1 Tax=Arabis alpina TaxID=50452 RepID=A0A087HJE3_ARAAL|nr:hypothetical protein AALP_AA2G230200 [Arabis alpina]